MCILKRPRNAGRIQPLPIWRRSRHSRTTTTAARWRRWPHQDWLDAKKKCFAYAERDEIQRAAFRQQVKQIAPHNRVYIDEAGVDDTLCYPYGWSQRNTRCPGQRLGHRTTRVSMAAAWCRGTVLAPLRFEGYCDAQLIEAWVAQQLVKELRPGQTVILDNASFPRVEPLRALLAKVQCAVLPLPPYSPDLNAIEPLWNQIKHKIMLDDRLHPSFRQKVDAAFV